MPDLAEDIGCTKPSMCGWLYSSLDYLKRQEVKIAVATVYNQEYKYKRVDNVDYYLLPLKTKREKYQKHLEIYWQRIYDEFKPEIVHIHGTEYPHGLAFVKSIPNCKTVISIQGLLNPILRYFTAELSLNDIIKNITFRDILFGSFVYSMLNDFRNRSNYEREILSSVSYVIGRTSWDKAHVLSINPSIKYYTNNETLRPFFYNSTWNYSTCKKHSIFVSQAGYPLKGLHQVLKAMPIVLRYYPDAQIYIAGTNILKGDRLIDKFRITGYGRYIETLIKKLKLKDKVFFLGQLNEEAMCEMFLQSNVYICPSSIENSPNSLGEAQLLGMPCIASYVGGVPDMMKEREEWLYRFEEYEMLAHLICKSFEIKEPFSRELALIRHNPDKNVSKLLSIYSDIITDND